MADEVRFLHCPKGNKIVVKLIGPEGTILDPSAVLLDALDYETDKGDQDGDGPYYPLSVLTGNAWRAMGLDGLTRWKYLREKEFKDIFGMSKATFEQLPSWKQLPLRRKHNLF